MERWQAMMEIAKILLGSIVEREKIEKITAILQQVLFVSRCVILEIKEDENNQKSYEITTAVPNIKGEHGIGEIGTISGKQAIEEVIRTKELLLVPDAKNDPLTSYMHHWARIKLINSVLLVPIVIDEVIAIMVYDASGDKAGFSKEEVNFANAVAAFIKELFVTEKEAYRLLQEAQHRETFRFSVELCDDIAHAVRPSLMVIGGYAQRMIKLVKTFAERGDKIPSEELLGASKAVAGEVMKSSELVQKEITSLEQVFKELVLLAKTEQRLNPVDVDINRLICEALTGLEKENPAFRCQMNLNPLPSLKLDVEKITLALRHILTNAFEEANKQQNPAHNEVLVSSRLKDKKVEVTIVNHGKLSKETVEHVLKPFVITAKTLGNNIVMGLPIARKLIALNGGEFSVKQEKNKDKVICKITFPCET